MFSWTELKSTVEGISDTTTYTQENPYVIAIGNDINTEADTASEIEVYFTK